MRIVCITFTYFRKTLYVCRYIYDTKKSKLICKKINLHLVIRKSKIIEKTF